jgi:ankyrin repeat protein
MREHCTLDLHDAVSFDLRDHVEARLRENPASVNKPIDHWEFAQSTPLHWAAAFNREAIAALLLENGADPNILAGNGSTALDVALEQGANAVAKLLERHGGRRSTDL